MVGSVVEHTLPYKCLGKQHFDVFFRPMRSRKRLKKHHYSLIICVKFPHQVSDVKKKKKDIRVFTNSSPESPSISIGLTIYEGMQRRHKDETRKILLVPQPAVNNYLKNFEIRN